MYISCFEMISASTYNYNNSELKHLMYYHINRTETDFLYTMNI